MAHEVDLVCDHLYNTKRLWVTNREPPEFSLYTFKPVWRTTFKRALLNRTLTSTQLHPHPPSSFQPPPSSFQLPSSSLQHPQQHSKKNITRNWAISPNLGRKIQSCPFCLKIGSKGILEALISKPDLDYWNSDPKIHFWANLGSKCQIVHFVWKLAYMVSQGCWFSFQH